MREKNSLLKTKGGMKRNIVGFAKRIVLVKT
jgi:hypothetical protein